MRNIRKQFNNLATLMETILHHRLQGSEPAAAHLQQIYKKISLMNLTQSYQQAITQMLIQKQTYQMKAKLNKFLADTATQKQQQLLISIHIDAYQPQHAHPYNSELWQFQLEMGHNEHHQAQEKEDPVFVHVVDFVINNLRCFSLVPGGLNCKSTKNKFTFNYTIQIEQKQENFMSSFENMSCHEAVLPCDSSGGIRKLTSKYYYNNSKFEEILKQIVVSRSWKVSQNSRKSSCDTSDSVGRINLFEYYDNELDITVLSNSDFGDSCQEIYLDLGKPKDPDNEEEFQILIEETENSDEKFLKDNFNLLSELSYFNL